MAEPTDDLRAALRDWPEDLVLRFARLPVGAEFTVRDLLPRPASVPLLTYFVEDAIARGRVRVVGKRPFLARRPAVRPDGRVSKRAIWLRVLKRVA